MEQTQKTNNHKNKIIRTKKTANPPTFISTACNLITDFMDFACSFMLEKPRNFEFQKISNFNLVKHTQFNCLHQAISKTTKNQPISICHNRSLPPRKKSQFFFLGLDHPKLVIVHLIFFIQTLSRLKRRVSVEIYTVLDKNFQKSKKVNFFLRNLFYKL